MNGECRCFLIAPPLCYLYLEWTKGVSFSSIRARCCPNLEFVRASKLTKRAWVRSVVPVLACAFPVWCCGYRPSNWWRRGVPFPLPVLSISHLSIWQLYHGNAIISCASDWFNGVLLDCNELGLVALILQDLIRQISCGLFVLIYPSQLHVLVIWSQNRLAYVIVWRIVDLCFF